MTIEYLRQRAHAVRDRFEEGRSALYRADGTQVYADAEHNERLAALRATRDAALREIDTEAASAIEENRASITALQNGDITALLTPDDLETASLRRSHVAGDVATLTTTERQDWLAAFLRGGDRTAMFAYLLAPRNRVRDISKTAGEPSSMTDTDPLAHRAAGGAASRTVAGPLGPCRGAGPRRA